MKLLETAGKTITKAAAAVVKAVTPAADRARDPWYSDDERRAAINEGAGGRARWLARRRGGWLR